MVKKIERTTHQLDAAGQSVGRLATQIVTLLRGKNRATFVPHLDNGDIVEVINCDKLKFTGNKLEQKEFIHHSGHPGGLKRLKMKNVWMQKPGEVVRHAVMGMLPKNKLRDQMIKRLIIK